jgi:hypothetical protein
LQRTQAETGLRAAEGVFIGSYKSTRPQCLQHQTVRSATAYSVSENQQ